MKTFTIDIDDQGVIDIHLKGYEEKSPDLAAIVEKIGKVQEKKWAPGQHAHIVDGNKVFHSH